MLKALEEQENKAKLVYFRIASKIEEGKHEGTNWSDGDCYKWIEAMLYVYGIRNRSFQRFSSPRTKN